ncbi:hypothetical protein BDP67DRAFT_10396 [Colletotrichum lupini]|nr:hypothetical protein BDP67DRAFT_10396 [Colletotrichum lupini]
MYIPTTVLDPAISATNPTLVFAPLGGDQGNATANGLPPAWTAFLAPTNDVISVQPCFLNWEIFHSPDLGNTHEWLMLNFRTPRPGSESSQFGARRSSKSRRVPDTLRIPAGLLRDEVQLRVLGSEEHGRPV